MLHSPGLHRNKWMVAVTTRTQNPKRWVRKKKKIKETERNVSCWLADDLPCGLWVKKVAGSGGEIQHLRVGRADATAENAAPLIPLMREPNRKQLSTLIMRSGRRLLYSTWSLFTSQERYGEVDLCLCPGTPGCEVLKPYPIYSVLYCIYFIF